MAQWIQRERGNLLNLEKCIAIVKYSCGGYYIDYITETDKFRDEYSSKEERDACFVELQRILNVARLHPIGKPFTDDSHTF